MGRRIVVNIIDLIEQGKVKRYFRARNKPCFEGAIGHITQRASGKEPLFLEESDYLYMLHLVKETRDKFKLSIHSFVLMSNHIHLLVTFKKANMAISMKNLFERYAKYFNKKYSRKGHLFCGAFRCALCFDESYLLAASLYIHFNPTRAKLAENPVDYRWSSCALFLRETSKSSFIDYESIFILLDSDISIARIKYGNLLEQLKLKKISDILELPKGLEYLTQILKENDKKWIKEHGLLGDYDLEQQIEELKREGRLYSPQARQSRIFLIEQLKARGFNISEIAKRLNVTRQIIHREQKKNPHF
jgi:putative transposase